MSTLKVTRIIIVCDGCGGTHDPDSQAMTAMDARMAAFTDGWQFPPRVTRKGRGGLVAASDACPDCSTNWVGKTAGECPPLVLEPGQPIPGRAPLVEEQDRFRSALETIAAPTPTKPASMKRIAREALAEATS